MSYNILSHKDDDHPRKVQKPLIKNKEISPGSIDELRELLTKSEEPLIIHIHRPHLSPSSTHFTLNHVFVLDSVKYNKDTDRAFIEDSLSHSQEDLESVFGSKQNDLQAKRCQPMSTWDIISQRYSYEEENLRCLRS